MKNFDEFIRNCEDGMATLDEILTYFKDYKVYSRVEPAIDDIYVVDDNNEVVAYFITWWDEEEDDGELKVYRLDDIWTHENFDIKVCRKGGM